MLLASRSMTLDLTDRDPRFVPIYGVEYLPYSFSMGCAPSSRTRREKLQQNDSNMVDSYVRIEREIWQIEQQAPASALTHAVLKLEKITSDLERLATDLSQNHNYTFNHVLNRISNVDDNSEDIDNSIKSAMGELRVTNNPKLATEHEEFIANLNRKALKCRQVHLLKQRKAEGEEEAAKLSDQVQQLQKLYEQLDTILSELFGSSHGLHGSKIESELDRLRNYRDTLYSGELAWRDAIKLSQSAAILAQVGFGNWQTISTTLSEDSKFNLATETRNAIHEAALQIQWTQSLLPAVQFPYCTQREISAVLQVIKYLYTDMHIPERYEHAKQVYKSFQKRASALSKWLQELTENTIHKDMEEVDKRIAEFVTKLNSERMIEIRKRTLDNTNFNVVSGLPNGMIADVNET